MPHLLASDRIASEPENCSSRHSGKRRRNRVARAQASALWLEEARISKAKGTCASCEDGRPFCSCRCSRSIVPKATASCGHIARAQLLARDAPPIDDARQGVLNQPRVLAVLGSWSYRP